MKNHCIRLAFVLVLLLGLLSAGAVALADEPLTIVPNRPEAKGRVDDANQSRMYKLHLDSGAFTKVFLRTDESCQLLPWLVNPRGTSDYSYITRTAIGSAGMIEKTVSCYLNAGDHYINVAAGRSSPYHVKGDYTLRVEVVVSSSIDAEPNDTIKQAVPIQLGKKMDGRMALYDIDYYTFTIDQDARMILKWPEWEKHLHGGMLRLYDKAGKEIKFIRLSGDDHIIIDLSKGQYWFSLELPSEMKEYQFTLSKFSYAKSIRIEPNPLPPLEQGQRVGLQVITTPANVDDRVLTWEVSEDRIVSLDWYSNALHHDRTNSLWFEGSGYGKVTLTATMEGGAKASIEVTVNRPKVRAIHFKHGDIQITKGFSYSAAPIDYDDRRAARPSLSWASSNPAVLQVNTDGSLKALSYGQSRLTATCVDNPKITATCTVTVGKNELRRTTRPKVDDYGIYSYARRLYYKGKYLYTEVCLYNYSPYKITKKGNLKLLIFDFDKSDTKPSYKKTISWNPGTIKPWKTKVYKFRLPKNKLLKRDLGTGQLEAIITGSFRAKSTGKGLDRDMVGKSLPTPSQILCKLQIGAKLRNPG